MSEPNPNSNSKHKPDVGLSARMLLGDEADSMDPETTSALMHMLSQDVGFGLDKSEMAVAAQVKDKDDGLIQPAANAIDYSDINEALDDGAPQPQPLRAPMVHIPAQPIEEDIDFDAPTPMQASSFAPPKPTGGMPPPKSPLVSVNLPHPTSSLISIGTTTPQNAPHQMPKPQDVPVPPRAAPKPVSTVPAHEKVDKKYVGSTGLRGGPALLFTEMFHGVLSVVPIPKFKPGQQHEALHAPVVEGDIDEYEIFDEPPDESDPSWQQRDALLSAKDLQPVGTSRLAVGGFPLLEGDAPPAAAVPPAVTASDLLPVQHLYWENDIIWDSNDTKQATMIGSATEVSQPDADAGAADDELDMPNPSSQPSLQSMSTTGTSAGVSSMASVLVESIPVADSKLQKATLVPPAVEKPSWASIAYGSEPSGDEAESKMEVDQESLWGAGASLHDLPQPEDRPTNLEDVISHSILPFQPHELVLEETPFDVENPSPPQKTIADLNDADLIFEDVGASETTEAASPEASGDEDENEEIPATGEAADTADGEKPKRKKRRHLQLPGRPISAAELMLRRKQEALKQLDHFNVSNDKFYINQTVTQKVSGEMKLRHSAAAYRVAMTKTDHTKQELLAFHKPRIAFKGNVRHKITLAKNKKKKSREVVNLEVARHKKDLSARDGRIILTEYTEEFPPLLMMVGMSTSMRNYYRKLDDQDVSAEPKAASLGLTDGDIVTLEPSEMSPFLGDIKKGTFVQSFENDLFKAPLAKHEVSETDFLLIRYGDSKDKWVIRDIPVVYAMGQEQPLHEVPAPNSRQAQAFLTRRLQQYIYHLFRVKKQAALKISDVGDAFRLVTDNALRKQLKSVADFIRGGDDSGSWILKDNHKLPTEAEIREQVSLEEICGFDAMMAGQERLLSHGVTQIMNVTPQITQAVQSMPDSHPLKPVAVFVEQELQLTPWNLTSNFLAAMRGTGLLQLSGFGDPSGRGEAFSYIKMPQKIPPKKVEEKEKEQKVVVHQTDADLRKLTLNEARDRLRQWGVPEDEIMSLKRWKVVGKIRELATKFKERGEGTYDDAKFARGNRHTVLAHQQQYNEKCQSIFENQIRALTDPNPPVLEDAIEDEFGSLLDEMDSALSGKHDKDKPKSGLAFQRMLAGQSSGDRLSAQEEADERRALAQALSNGDGSIAAQQTENTTAPVSDKPTAEITAMALPPMEKHAVYYVKKTIKRADGTSAVEIIKDKITVEEYLKKYSYNPDKKPSSSSTKRSKLVAPEDSDKQSEKKRERRRIQEQKRRSKGKGIADAWRAVLEKVQSIPGYNDALDCAACRLPGHITGSAICPRPNPFDAQEGKFIGEKDPEIAEQWAAVLAEITKIPHYNDQVHCGSCRLPGHMKTNKACPKRDLSTVPDYADEEVDANNDGVAAARPRRAATKKRSRASLIDGEADEEDDEDIIFASDEGPRKRQKTSSRPKGPQSRQEVIAKHMRPVFMRLYQHDDFGVFKVEPNPAQAPDYYDVIAEPMWMSKIRGKLDKKQYLTPEEFLSDMKLIRDNCYKYNATRYPMMLPLADHFYEDFIAAYNEAIPALLDSLDEFEQNRATQQQQLQQPQPQHNHGFAPSSVAVAHNGTVPDPMDIDYPAPGFGSDGDIQVD